MSTIINSKPTQSFAASVYCPLCTHTVNGEVFRHGKGLKVVPGQRCSRCHSSLDAGFVFNVSRAA